MGYRELLDLYRDGQLDGEKKQMVEADIDRQEAISEYLFEKEGQELSLEFSGRDGCEKDDGSQIFRKEQADFARMVKRSIRKALLKTAIAAASIALAVVLFVMFALPNIVDRFYYNPGAPIGEAGNQMSLDLEVYTELRMPGNQRDTVIAHSRGYGEHDILVDQWFSYNGAATNVAGKILRGNLTFYDPNVLVPPPGNAFAWSQLQASSEDSLSDLIDRKKNNNFCAAGDQKAATQRLKELDGNRMYLAYASLDKMMPYEAFVDYLENLSGDASLGHIWCAVCTRNGIADSNGPAGGQLIIDNLGFYCSLSSSHNLDWDRGAYPDLVLWDYSMMEDSKMQDAQEEALREEGFAKRHLISMLRYMSCQEEFLGMMGDMPQKYNEAARYIEENGLMVYGFAGVGKKENILNLNNDGAVYEIYTQELR